MAKIGEFVIAKLAGHAAVVLVVFVINNSKSVSPPRIVHCLPVPSIGRNKLAHCMKSKENILSNSQNSGVGGAVVVGRVGSGAFMATGFPGK